ncbi:MAG: helix-turn-helix domain-containing protein [Polyangiaceae bacterium]
MAEPSRRAQILEAAHRLLRHYGPQKTTMADVAREASIGVGTVYLEFPSKDALVEELSRKEYRAVLDGMRRAIVDAGPRAGDRLVRALEARAVAFLALVDGTGAHACDLLHCGSDAVRAAQGSYRDQEREVLQGILEQGRDSGELDVEDIDVTLHVILLAYASFAPPWIFKTDPHRLGTDIAAMHALVLRGLLARSR